MSTTDEYSIGSTDYEVGQNNVQKWGFDIHNPVLGDVYTLTVTLLFGAFYYQKI